ncbi:Ig-like domain-containing protein [Turneriella parva]|uniref:Fibronectin type III domain protein n=1 Tax=Turneriella parva (strain ATCC BAA-1111 / DSM 21527 / NCTC 11395 / H) TaxID=869212 RepID=I4B259_TURPD|nr:Ig-like domain-containing protein [Turneriella parva]AFM11366.1 hypothetical protein Turpa_0715 [Turneriella parva DSM 21527]
MQKIRLIVPIIFATLLAACGGGGSASGAAADPGGGSGQTGDTTAPTVGAAISFSGISDTTITVSWGAASDAGTATANLQYRLVRAASAAEIDTIAKVDDAAAGVTVIDNYTAALTSRNVTGLAASTTYFFAVVVRDAVGNKAIYTPASATTSVAGTTASPVFNPAPGTFGTAPNLQMTSSTSGAVICYTSNGATPVCNGAKTGCTTGILYSSAISVAATATYKAIACKTGNTDSSETSGLYTIDTTAPTVASTTPADSATGISTGSTIAVTFSEAMTPSTLKAATTTSCLTDSPTVQVSTNNFANCIPMTSATLSTSDNITFTMTPASALSTFTVYKIRVTTGAQDVVGNAIAAQYTSPNGFTTALAGALTINSLTPASGTYSTAQAAAATTTETGASICYTTNGVDPTAGTPGTCDTSFVNEGQTIAIGTTLTLKVLATKAGHTNSAVATRNYTITPAVTGTLPANGDTGADPAGTITIGFSKTMNRTSFSFNATAGACSGNIQVSADNFTNCIGFTIPAGNASSFVLTPAATLASATTYKVKVTTGAQDTSGNAATAFEHATGFTTRYYRTESIDGTNNFVAGETFATTQGVAGDVYVTADSTYLYVGVRHTDIQASGAGAGNKFAYILFATDLNDANGLNTSSDSKAKFGAASKMRWHWKTRIDGANYTEYQQANGTNWSTTWNDNKNDWRAAGYVEARILLTEFGGTAPSAIKIAAYIVDYNGDSGNGWVYNLLSGATEGSGSVARDLVKYIDYNRTLSTTPNATATGNF